MTSPGVKIPQSSTYVTGHCGNGNHEGSKNVSKSGSKFTACLGDYKYRNMGVSIRCSCWCHQMFRDARALMPVTVSDPIPTLGRPQSAGSVAHVPSQHAPSVMGTAPEPRKQAFWDAVVRNEDLEPQLRRMIKKLVLGISEPASEMQFLTKKEDGRRARGSLDINVEAVCRLKLEGFIPQELTPTNIGMLINALDPPSAGAVHAVFMRWQAAGYCEVGSKPIMLLGFTSLVGENGITGARKLTARDKEARAKGFF